MTIVVDLFSWSGSLGVIIRSFNPLGRLTSLEAEFDLIAKLQLLGVHRKIFQTRRMCSWLLLHIAAIVLQNWFR